LTSLVVSVTLIPMLAALGQNAAATEPGDVPGPVVRRLAVGLQGFWDTIRALTAPVGRVLRFLEWRFARLLHGVTAAYCGLLSTTLQRRWWVFLLVAILWGGIAYLGTFLRQTFMPELYQGVLTAEVVLPVGTPLATTAHMVQHLESMTLQHGRIRQIYSSIGRQQRSGGMATAEREHLAQLYLQLTPPFNAAEEAAVLSDLRQSLQTLPGVQVQFARPSYFSFAMPLEIELRGYDLRLLRAVTQRWLKVLESLPGLHDLRSSVAPGEPELHITFERQKVAALGLDIADIATIIKQNVQGEIATAMTRVSRDVDIRVRAHPSLLQGIEAIKRLRINPGSAVPIPLSAVATLTVARGPIEIRHEDLQRVALITANVQGQDLGDSMHMLQRWLAQQPLPPGFSARLRGQSTEMTTAFQSLLFALALATFLVYLVLASQFESFVQPLLILFAVPLGLSGVVLTLWLSGQTINVLVYIGAVLLVGIVVNNAIVLVDYGNQCRRRGRTRRQAIEEAALVRFRPILMTTSTTVLGLVPMALGLGYGGAELRAPLAITVIGGLLVATLLTLLVIPAAYSVMGSQRVAVPSPLPTSLVDDREWRDEEPDGL
jgi:HAE1 family hydrophobic/amphiphilic exporter-1